MTAETQAPTAPAAPDTLTPTPSPEPAREPDEPAETNDVVEAAVDPEGGVWRCLNATCPSVALGETFLGPTQAVVQASQQHVVCPACQNDPAPHYIYVGDKN